MEEHKLSVEQLEEMKKMLLKKNSESVIELIEDILHEEEELQNARDLKNLIKKVEIKRVEERITKKELCKIFELCYTSYMNCVNGRSVPSRIVTDALKEYLKLPTGAVYNMLLKSREKEKDYHPRLMITEMDVQRTKNELKANGVW